MSDPQTLVLDLTPRGLVVNAQEMGGMSATDLSAINTYIDEVNLVWASVPDFRIPSALEDMVQAATTWRSKTYFDIRDMTVSLSEYGLTAAPARYLELKDALHALDAGEETVSSTAVSILDALIDTCKQYLDRTLEVVNTVSGFSEAMGRAEDYIRQQIKDHEGRPIEDWQGLIYKAVEKSRSDPENALRASQRIFGVWQSLYTDMLEVRKTTSQLMDSKIAFIIDVRIDLAVDQWRAIGEGALDFRKSMDAPVGG